jgi:hypothetical protein
MIRLCMTLSSQPWVLSASFGSPELARAEFGRASNPSNTAIVERECASLVPATMTGQQKQAGRRCWRRPVE